MQTPSRRVIKVCSGCVILPWCAHSNVVVLRIHPDDADALSTKLFLLLQTDHYEIALDVIDGRGDKSKFSFERAYALYRSHEDIEAHKAIKALKERNANDRGIAHLEAQLVCLYRLLRAVTSLTFSHL